MAAWDIWSTRLKEIEPLNQLPEDHLQKKHDEEEDAYHRHISTKAWHVKVAHVLKRTLKLVDGTMPELSSATEHIPILDFIPTVLRGVGQVTFMNNPISGKNNILNLNIKKKLRF